MILLTVTTLVCVTANLVIEYYKDKHYNTNSVMFVAEILKLLVSFTITQWMVPWNVPSLNFYFAINAALYCGINLLTWVILALVPPALYVMLLQHRMFWVVSLSAVFLKRRYTRRHYTACFLVLIGCVIVNYRDALYDRPSVLGVFYIMLQAFLSGLTAVWTEKMMKAARGPPAAIAHDAVRLKLYWFLVDSYQMYLFGLPMYFAVAVYGSADRAEVPPFELLRVASLFVCHGMLLGAVYVWHSAVVRSFVGAAVIPLTMLATGFITTWLVIGGILVCLGLVIWTVDDYSPITRMFSLRKDSTVIAPSTV